MCTGGWWEWCAPWNDINNDQKHKITIWICCHYSLNESLKSSFMFFPLSKGTHNPRASWFLDVRERNSKSCFNADLVIRGRYYVGESYFFKCNDIPPSVNITTKTWYKVLLKTILPFKIIVTISILEKMQLLINPIWFICFWHLYLAFPMIKQTPKAAYKAFTILFARLF